MFPPLKFYILQQKKTNEIAKSDQGNKTDTDDAFRLFTLFAHNVHSSLMHLSLLLLFFFASSVTIITIIVMIIVITVAININQANAMEFNAVLDRAHSHAHNHITCCTNAMKTETDEI